MVKRRLGKGFGSLLPEDFDESILLDKKDRVQKISLNLIAPDANQPRKYFDQDKLNELAESIKAHGILQPIVVRPEAETYVIIAGERRFRAAAIAGINSVPVLVRSSKELERLEIGLIENVQRVDLSPLEQAVSIAKLNEQFNLDISAIAKRLGKADSTIINIVRLLKLPEEAKQALANNKISEGHARSILALGFSPSQQKNLLNFIIKNGWSVRRAEQFVNECKNNQPAKKAASAKSKTFQTAQTKAIAKKFSAEVAIKSKAKGGEVNISYKNDEDLERILKLLA